MKFDSIQITKLVRWKCWYHWKIWTHRIEVQCFQDDFTAGWTRCVRTCADDAFNSRPLVDQQRLISITEPRQIRQPLKVRWNRSGVEEKSTKDQERNDNWWADAQSHWDWRTCTWDEITEWRWDVSNKRHNPSCCDKIENSFTQAYHRISNACENNWNRHEERKLRNRFA